MRRIGLILLLVIGVSSPLFAQNMSTNTETVISSVRGRVVLPSHGDFGLYFDQEIRSTDSFGVFKDSRSSVFATYDPLPWFKVMGGYVFLVKEGTTEASLKHRYVLLFKQVLGLGNFNFKLRERFESTYQNGKIFGSEEVGESVNLLRTRLKINYNNGKQRVVPYIYTELYNQINEDMALTRVRSQAGVECSLTKSSKLTAFYQYAHFATFATSTAPHTFGMLYTYKIKSKK